MRLYLVQHGCALGAIVALHRVGKVSDVLYEGTRQKIVGTRNPTEVGRA